MVETPVVVAGAGGLGSHVLMSLARLAPLTIEIWDPAIVDPPDLNRQILYTEESLGRCKTEAATEMLRRINGELTILTQPSAISKTAFTERSTVDPPFVLFDCLDSFAARAELEAIRIKTGCTVIHGGVEGWYGQVTTIPGSGPGYTDVFGPRYAAIPAATKPILPTTVATVAALQVTEYIQLCTDPTSTPLTGTLAIYDGHRMTIDLMELDR